MQEPGTKIRVLGCVHQYMIDSGTLVLKGEYAATGSKDLTIFAGIDNVLESVNHELLQIGSWVNIVGYVRPQTQVAVPSKKRRKSNKTVSIPTVEVYLLWSAGAIKLIDYQSAVRSFQSTSREGG